jgi:DNA-binding NtrC family response regulator
MKPEDAKPVIGVVDDERNIQLTLASIFERRGYQSAHAYTGRQGMDMIENQKPSVVLLDLGLPDGEGLAFLKQIRQQAPQLPVIVITANDSLNNAVESIKLGAFHFLSKPYVPEELLSLVQKAIEQQTLREETKQLRQETNLLREKIRRVEARLAPSFKNYKMKELVEMIDLVGPSDANVFLTGESGVGKEVFANWIHEKSPRSSGPMVKLNCAAFPQNMIEGELFGYKKGAFTGALQDFPGMISTSSGGTLFLDEIAEMPAELQTRFLRVLQEREYRPLGSTQTHKADFRLVAATNQKVDEALKNGKLREDLYYRLNTFRIEIPPLRERREDIVELANLFLERFSEKMNKPGVIISAETFEILLNYHWPGNVRELQNVIERAVVLAREGIITPKTLPTELNAPPMPQACASPVKTVDSVLNLAEREKATLLAALAEAKGNKKKAAQLLGIHRPTLYTKLKKFGLSV